MRWAKEDSGGEFNPGPPPKRDFNQTDTGNAERLIALHGENLRYTQAHGWLTWTGTHWQRDTRGRVEQWAVDTVRRMYAEAATVDDEAQRNALAKYALGCENHQKLVAMVKCASTSNRVRIDADDLDRDPWLLHVRNGTVDPRTGKLREHRRGDLITKLAPVMYTADAECPLWLAFLDRILAGNERMLGFVQRAVGSTWPGVVREQVLHLLWGSGANGKSTFLDVLVHALGDYATTAPPKLLVRQRQDAHPTELADLFGARFVVSVETGEGGRLDEERVKLLTGGDRIKARLMRRDFFEFTHTHTLFLATNHRPIVRGTDLAIWRRIRLWPFTVAIPEPEQDKALPEKLKAEAPGILRWAVEGCLAWQRDGLAAPDEVADATAEYRHDSDLIRQWLDERCRVAPGLRTRGGDLYSDYKTRADQNGERPMSGTMFGRKLVEHGFDKHKDTHVVYSGVGLISCNDGS